MLTISQLAAYAGVTVRAVRHYHAKGLLPEPERDASGYRRYDANAVVELIRIRTLAGAGVPLARVQELLDADHDEFAAAIDEIDQRLQEEIRERQAHRKRIADLASGDSLALPSDVVAYLDRMRELGLPETVVEAERDGWIMIAAQSPAQMPMYMASKRAQIEDPEVVELYKRLAETVDWSPDDSRVPELADWLAALLTTTFDAFEADELQDDMPDDFVDLLDSLFIDNVPIARRLMALLEERGWSGWTRFIPVDPG